MSPTTRVRKADPDRGTAVETFMPGRYEGRVAVVTGAASGIGTAFMASMVSNTSTRWRFMNSQMLGV